MFLGDKLFYMEGGQLAFAVEPVLPGWLFREDGTLSFRYLGCRFSYVNPSGRHTYGPDGARPGRLVCGSHEFSRPLLPSALASRLREKKLEELTVLFE